MLEKLRKMLLRIDESARNAQNSATVYMGGDELLTRLYTGQKMFLDRRDLSETPHLAIDGYWEIDISRVFEAAVRDGDVVIDVGATFGYYGMLARRGSKIVSVDPNPVYQPYLHKNMTVNGLIDRSVISPLAIGGKKGSLTLHTLKDDWASSTLQDLKEFNKHRDIPYEVESEVEVGVVTLDQLCKDNDIEEVHVLKLDIEGMEEDAYHGMKKTIENSPELCVFMEFSPEAYTDGEAFYKQLAKDFPYRYIMPRGSNLADVTTYDQVREAMGQDWAMLIVSKRELPADI